MNLSRQEYVKLRAEYADLAAKHKELRRQGRYKNGDERLEALRKEWSVKRGYPYVPRRNALGTRVAPQPPSEEDKAEDAKSARGTRGIGRAKPPEEDKADDAKSARGTRGVGRATAPAEK